MPRLIALKQQAYAEIDARYTCAHVERQLRARTIADGRQSFVTQCIRCGHTSSPIARKAAEALSRGKPIPRYDDHLDTRWRERKSAEYRQVFQLLAPSLAAEYEAYLRSTAWHERRNAALARASHRCEVCQTADATEVHHRTYIRLGNELPTDLLAVCETCHELIHAATIAQSGTQAKPTSDQFAPHDELRQRFTSKLRVLETMIPRGKANALVNRDEDRISREVYDLYLFLKQHPLFSTAPHRFKDVLRASVSGTPFGFIFRGLVSEAAAKNIDEHITSEIKGDPCVELQRDHFYTWKDNAEFFLSQPVLEPAPFWAEMKRRNEVVFVTREEHRRLGSFQRAHGLNAYALADIRLVHVDPRAMKLAGYKAAFVRNYWPAEADRSERSLPVANLVGESVAQTPVSGEAPRTPRG